MTKPEKSLDSTPFPFYNSTKCIGSKCSMNKTEAKQIVHEELEIYRTKPYSELVKMINVEPISYELKTPRGICYQIEIQAFWDDKPNGNVRVMGSIDDSGWRAFFPVSSDFIKSPDDKFVDE